jgi:hypothetical protein
MVPSAYILVILILLVSSIAIEAFQLKFTSQLRIKAVNDKYVRKDFMLSSSDPANNPVEDLEETTKKYGLEVGLWKSFKNRGNDKSIKPQDLLAKYGGAYLLTSITLAIISYAICYLLVSNGVDVAALLEKIGIQASSASSTAGTAGIAYAIHKAASPIRFPPTVALTPVVAGWLGKKSTDKTNDNADK